MDEYYLLTFESTHAAISTEKLLKPAEVTIMPVPRFISASCGISIRIKPDMREAAEEIFKTSSKLTHDDYTYYHVTREEGKAEVNCVQIDYIN